MLAEWLVVGVPKSAVVTNHAKWLALAIDCPNEVTEAKLVSRDVLSRDCGYFPEVVDFMRFPKGSLKAPVWVLPEVWITYVVENEFIHDIPL
jgi:hypothetical protein